MSGKSGKFERREKIINVTENEGNAVNSEEDEDRIAKRYIDKTIFITGGTGFLGKVVIEKLLRTCSSLKKIYILIREKNGKSPQERLKEMLANELFGLVKKQRGEEAVIKQVEAIRGDVILPKLGLSKEDRKKLVNEVDFILHSAATVRFDEPLRKAVFINTRGTKYMLELALECKKLIGFGHVSTAYCHCQEKIVYEKPYPPPADPEAIIKMCEKFDEETISIFEKKILGPCPNTYCFTKALAEDLVVKTFDQLPSGILRPSIVIPIWKEPLPGWVDNINGPTGLLIGAGRGVIRTMYMKADGYGDFLPVDVAVNGLLLASWYGTEIDKFKTRVGHITSSNEVQVTWNELVDIGRWTIENRVPFNTIAWYPGGSMKSSRLLHNIATFLFQIIPAFIGDVFIKLAGYPPVLKRVQRRVMQGYNMLEYYTNREWHFDNTEGNKARACLNKKEKAIYSVEKEDLDVYAFIENCVYCARRYILKTPDDMIPAAKRQMKIMWFVDRFCKTTFLLWLTYFTYTRFVPTISFEGILNWLQSY